MEQTKRYRDQKVTGPVLENDRGVALVIVMVMLVMLTFIGLAALSTSSTELFLSANYLRSRESFEAAEGIMSASIVDTTNFFLPAGGSGTVTPLSAGTIHDTNPSNNGTVTSSGTVTFLRTDAAPANSGSSALMNQGKGQKANYFIIDTTGTGSLGASSRQEWVMAKIVPGG